MKLFKNLKKGFTLIELVVVIAVIAILSAVSVVSYVAITNKAKTSSDEQAVTQMNTILTANEVMDLRSIRDVLDAFAENGLDAEDYKPLMKDRYFFWDADENKIIYTDENYKVLFPESLKEKSKEGAHWLSLSGKIQERDYSSNLSNGSGTITGTATEAGEKLYKLAQDVKSGSNTALAGSEAKTITLPEKVDLAGSEFNLGTVKNLTLKGESPANKTEIDNFFTSEYQNLGSAGNRKTRAYHAGLIQTVEGNVTFENLNIKNVTIGDYDVSMSAIFAGQVKSGAVLTIKNCTIEDAYIYGEQKVAAVAAYVTGGKIVMEGCTFKNVHIYSEEGCAGGVTGYADALSVFDIKSSVVESIKNNVACELTKVSDRLYKTVNVSLTDASNEVVSTFNSYVDRRPEYGKDKHPELDGKRRFKPGCATFGWIADSIIAPEGADYYVDYGLKPLHSSDMVK